MDLGGVPDAHPQGSRFSHFDIKFFEMHLGNPRPPLYEVHVPLQEILDPPLQGMS